MWSNRTGWALLAPSLFVLTITGLLPFVYVLYVGFFDWNIFAADPGLIWAGANNYRRLMFDAEFLTSMRVTLKFTFWAVGTELVLGFFLAQLLTRDFRGKAVFRTLHALPLLIAPISVGATWRLMTIPGFGPVPFYLDRWFDWEYNIGTFASHAFSTTVLMDVWHWTPLVTLTMLAGLSAMPKEPFEAALVDGASRWQLFRYVTIPMIMPVILTTTFIRIMDAMRVVDEVWMLTGGGPGNATRYAGIHIWRAVFPKTDYGYGSAMSLLVLYFTIVLCWLLFIAMTQTGRNRGT
ncbi:sugar ABC transporter permease [Chloroflexi bacterium TSY]|nr:sugar ABC transporter permease [Chloroflexi bacterium TSY]